MMRFGQLVIAGSLFLGAGCQAPGETSAVSTDGPVECTDRDGDEHGVGDDCLGPDCDDSNPTVYDNADCEALCGEDPHSTGCSCDHEGSPQPEICYLGDPTVLGVGPCRSGFRRCDSHGYWTECQDQVLPTEDFCDTVDNDCDGEVDEGVTNECGTCAPECYHDCVGVDCGGFNVDDEGDNVETCGDDPDCITLGSPPPLDVIWIVNTSESTVSKVNTEAREEEGRYILTEFGRTYQAYASRTSVDYRGDVVVANRAYGYTSSVTKVANDDCGAGDTSTGRDDVLPWGEDACVMWNTELDVNAVANAVAVHDRVGGDGALDEMVWVGASNQRKYYEIDRTDGELTGEEADCSPCYPYGAAIDADGRLWSACGSSNVCTFDTEDPDEVEQIIMPGYNLGIAVDEEGRVWTGGTCAVYDPEEEEWQTVVNCSGYAAAADGHGSVWITSSYCNGTYGTCRIDTETLEMTGVTATSYGISVDFDGFIWAVPSYQTGVYVIDPGAGPGDEEYERVELNLTGPDTYSDMTGYQLGGSLGRYRHVFEGCDDETTIWGALLYDANTPTETTVTIELRMANTLAALGAQPWIELGSTDLVPSPIQLEDFLPAPPHARFMEVQFTLSTTGDAKPTVRRFEMQWYCDLPIG